MCFLAPIWATKVEILHLMGKIGLTWNGDQSVEVGIFRVVYFKFVIWFCFRLYWEAGVVSWSLLIPLAWLFFQRVRCTLSLEQFQHPNFSKKDSKKFCTLIFANQFDEVFWQLREEITSVAPRHYELLSPIKEGELFILLTRTEFYTLINFVFSLLRVDFGIKNSVDGGICWLYTIFYFLDWVVSDSHS